MKTSGNNRQQFTCASFTELERYSIEELRFFLRFSSCSMPLPDVKISLKSHIPAFVRPYKRAEVATFAPAGN